MQGVKKAAVQILSKNQKMKLLCIKAWVTCKRIQYEMKYARKYQVKEKLIVFEAYTGRQYSCNPRALYEELLRSPEYKDYKKVWAFQEPEKYRYLEQDRNTKVVKYKSPSYYKAYAMAAVWVSNFRIPHEIQPKHNQRYVQTWHGTPLKRLVFDISHYQDANSSEEELRYHCVEDVKRYSYMLAPSEFYAEKLTSAFHLKELDKADIFIHGGYPRNDYLLRLDETEMNRCREKMGIPAGKRVVLYAPTWRESQHKPGEGYSYQLAADFAKWRSVLGEDTVILFRCHYLVSSSVDLSPFRGFVIDASGYDDINELYAISDLLITDYSSVFFDYANLKRPVIFYMYDYQQYKNEMRDFYLEERELPGPIVQTEEELLGLLDGEWSFPSYIETYEKFNEKFNPYREGDGSRIVWETVLSRKERE